MKRRNGERCKRHYPWWRLGKVCQRVHRLRRNPQGADPEEFYAVELRRLFDRCSRAKDRREAIVYWDARSLLAQWGDRLDEAVDSRAREIEQIEKLHRLVETKTDDAAILEGYEEPVLAERRELLAKLRERLET